MRRQGLYDPSLRLRVGYEVGLFLTKEIRYGVVSRHSGYPELSIIVKPHDSNGEEHWPPKHTHRIVWSFNGPIRCVK